MRSIRYVLAAVLLPAFALVTACGAIGGDGDPKPTPTPTPTTPPIAFAQTPPAPSATPAPTISPTRATPTTYTVEPGDNPTLIATSLGVPADQVDTWVAEMLALNDTEAKLLQVGQELLLPAFQGGATAIASPTTVPSNTPVTTETAVASPVATSGNTPVPSSTASANGFGDGIRVVGVDLFPGTYRTRTPAEFCYWARLSGFGGTDDEIISDSLDENGYSVVTILPSDAGFKSEGCGSWSADLSAVTSSPQAAFSDGTYIVGTDIAPGTWTTPDASDTCYWERTSGFGASLEEVVESGIQGPTVTIEATDAGFYTAGCGTWTRAP